MTTTPNLGLTKDAETGELYSVARVNANSDRIDDFAGQTNAALAGKQDTLTFDNAPTEGSTNPVQSGGVYKMIAGIYGAGSLIESGDDLNDYTTAGVFYSSNATISGSLTNTPHTSTAFSLIVYKPSSESNNPTIQILYPVGIGAVQQFYKRVRGTAGSWGDWCKYLSETQVNNLAFGAGTALASDANLFELSIGKYYSSNAPTSSMLNIPSDLTTAFYCEVVNTVSSQRRKIFLHPCTAATSNVFYTCLETSNGYGTWYKFEGTAVT